MWRLVPFRMWLLAALVGVFAAACGGDEPAPAFEPQAVPASERVVEEDEPASRHAEDAELEAEPLEQASGAEEVEDSPQEQVEAQQSESRPIQAPVQSTRAQHEEEEPTEDLTDLTGVVLADADVRARPGLAWLMIHRLTSGEPVVVLNRGGGWYRISYGDGLEGWMRSTALDLGEIDGRSVLRQPAPAILAEWRGVEYGVMGQSADGAEVRLLALDDELSAILGAPRDEVTLLVDDVTLDDLPILIGDETVVFPGDDFRVGQGKILPKANEWMWLPWGWLLAHNDEHIWQWRPETDELEFVRRPPGFARLSPDGKYLAIANLCPRGLECSTDNDVVIVPLDGSPHIAFTEELRDFEVAPTLGITSNRWVSNLEWSGNSRAVKLRLSLFDRGREPNAPTTLLFHIEGHMVRFEEFWERELQGSRCYVEPPFPGSSSISGWEFHDHETVASTAMCSDADGDGDYRTAVFTLAGEFIRFDPAWPQGITDEDAARLRSAEGADALGEHIRVVWSPSRQHAVVIEQSIGRVRLYHARQHVLRTVDVRSDQSTTESQTWPTVDPDEDLQGWACCRVYWSNDERAAVFALWDVYTYGLIHSAIALNLQTGEGVEFDLFGNTRISLQRQGSWYPRGESFQILVGEAGLTAPDAEGLNLFSLLIFRHDGGLRSALFATGGCRLLDAWAQVPRYRADWSPDGKRFAVGGHEPGGLYYCPSEE